MRTTIAGISTVRFWPLAFLYGGCGQVSRNNDYRLFDLMPPRRFPTSWSVEERPGRYIVKDATGFPLAYVYYQEEPGRRTAAQLMTQDEAHRIVVNIAKLPELLRRD
jgi:endo-1,4-beta-D-glucanase Y